MPRLLQPKALGFHAPFAVPCLEEVERALRKGKGGCLRDLGSKRLMPAVNDDRLGPIWNFRFQQLFQHSL